MAGLEGGEEMPEFGAQTAATPMAGVGAWTPMWRRLPRSRSCPSLSAARPAEVLTQLTSEAGVRHSLARPLLPPSELCPSRGVLGSLRSSAVSGVAFGLSEGAQAENAKASRVLSRISEAQQPVGSQDCTGQRSRARGSLRGASLASLHRDPDGALIGDGEEPSFEEELRICQGKLEEMGKSIRLEHLRTRPPLSGVELEAERREERRRGVERGQRLHRHAKQTQNPQRRVALRMEQARMSQEGAASPPVQTVDYHGPCGVDRIEMVNVSVLQSRCRQLNKGANARSLMEGDADPKKDERVAAQARSAGPGAPASWAILRNRDEIAHRSASNLQDVAQRRAVEREQRAVQAARQRRAVQEEKHLHAKREMRVAWDSKESPRASTAPANSELRRQGEAAQVVRS